MDNKDGYELGLDPTLSAPTEDTISTIKLESKDLPKRSIICRYGVGTVGRRIPLVANHFKAHINVPDSVFYQYSVCLNFIYVNFPHIQ